MDVNIALLAGDGIGPEIIAEPTRQAEISYAVFCLKKKKKSKKKDGSYKKLKAIIYTSENP